MTTKSDTPWDELRVYRDDPSGVTFEIVFHGDDDTYVSEVYCVEPGETVESAAMKVCLRFGWIENRPGDSQSDD